MKLLATVFALTTLMLVMGCATSLIQVAPVPTESQEVFYQAGQPFVISKKTHAVVLTIAPSTVHRERTARLLIAFLNPTKSEVLVAPETITATYLGSPLKVFSHEELMQQEQTRQSKQRFGLALKAAGAALQGGSRTEHYSGTVDADSPRGGSSAYSGTARVEDPASAAHAQAKIDQEIAQFTADSKTRMDDLAIRILGKHTLSPGTKYSGEVWVRLPDDVRDSKFQITIPFANEVHAFDVSFREFAK